MDWKSYRGKCHSKSKMTKAGQPKMAGNFSYQTFHYESLQTKDYDVYLHQDKETGIELLVMADEKTPLANVLGGDYGEMIATLALRDPNFRSYHRDGEYKGLGNGKAYEAKMILTKLRGGIYWNMGRYAKLRMEIYTDGDFRFEFPEY